MKYVISFLTVFLVILSIIGVIFVYSSSYCLAYKLHNDNFYYVYKQIIGFILAYLLTFVISNIKKQIFINYASVFFVITLSFCLLPHMPVIGVMLNGAKRWINCFFFIAQPIEIFKPFFIVMCAKFFIKQYFQPHRMLIGFIIISFVTSVVLLLQPDYGQMIILLTTGFLMFVSTQKNIKMIVSISFIGSIILGALALAKPYRIKRILIFLNPFDDPQGKGFQIIQSLIAISKGGFWGCGIGYSQQKVSYLPMQHTDFIFSIICEEIGIFGGIIIVGFFIIIATVLCYISMRIKDPCSSLIVLGISYMFLIQSGINILVATASLPTKGIGLPLISYGISSLIGYGICFGIVYLCINDDKKNKYYEYLT